MAFEATTFSSLLDQDSSSVKVVDIPLSQITCEEQIRQESNKGFDVESLQKLAGSIKDVGLQEPVILRRNDSNTGYILVCGERRYRATKLAGLETIPAIVKEELTDPKTILILQITENAQREGISNIELALGAKKLLDLGMSREDICQRLHISRSNLSELSKMLQLPDFLMDLLKKGTLSDSPRTCADFQRFYEAYPEETKEYIQEYLRDLGDEAMSSGDVLLDRRVFKEMKDAIESKKIVDVNPYVTTEEDTLPPNDNSDNYDEPDPVNDEADPAVFNADQGEQSQESNQHEPSVATEREHPEQPTMFASSQENNAPTATVGSSSDYTDRDTRETHDLSDSIENAEEGEEQAQGTDPNSSSSVSNDSEEKQSSQSNVKQTFSSFRVNYGLVEYELTNIRGRDEVHVMLRDQKGNLKEVDMSEICLIKGI